MADDTPAALGALQVDEGKLRGHVDEVVRSSVEETLNGLLDAEADQICRAQRYERSPERVDGRAGHYERKLETKAGEVTLRVPKLRRLPFETAIIERYKRRESSVEEALVEMYLAGVSVRRVEDITEALWGTRVSSGTVSRLNQKIYRHIEAWRNREITGEFPYVYLDGVILKRSWAGEVNNISVLIAIGVGDRWISANPGCCRGREGRSGGLARLPAPPQGSRPQRRTAHHLGRLQRARRSGCRGVSQDGLAALRRSLLSQRVQPRAERQGRRSGAHAQGDPRPGEIAKRPRAKATEIVARLKEMKLRTAAELVEQKVSETMTYYAYPSTHWRQMRTNNPLERIIREIRRRTRVVGAFPDGHSALMLVAARLRHIASTKWGKRRYLVMDPLLNPAKQEVAA